MGFNSFKAMWEMTDHLKATTTEMSVLYALAYIMNDKTFACHPSQRLIAKKTRLSLTTVKSTLRKLRAKGLVDWTKHTAAVNRYSLSFLPFARPATDGTQGGHPALSDLDMLTVDAIATEFARLCGSVSNFAYNRNTYRKLIRERDLPSCEDLLHTITAEIRQDEHPGAKNIGTIITMRLKKLPVKVINNPSGATPATGQQPSTGGTGAVHRTKKGNYDMNISSNRTFASGP